MHSQLSKRKRSNNVQEDIEWENNSCTGTTRVKDGSLGREVSDELLEDVQHGCAHSSDCLLLSLPDGLLDAVMQHLSSDTLVVLSRTCKAFWRRDRTTSMRPSEKAAKGSVLAVCGYEQSHRWRTYSWLERLRIEECVTLFDQRRAEKNSFVFERCHRTCAVTSVRLDGMGPKLLVSDLSTADSAMLRWRIQLKGNTAVEFGIVPLALQDCQKAMHKCVEVEPDGDRPVGFSSAITAGSLLPSKLTLAKGSVIEMLAWRNRIELLVTNPPGGRDRTWLSQPSMSKVYTGPQVLRLELEYQGEGPYKLAITAWAKAAFDILHTQPLHMRPTGSDVSVATSIQSQDN